LKIYPSIPLLALFQLGGLEGGFHHPGTTNSK